MRTPSFSRTASRSLIAAACTLTCLAAQAAVIGPVTPAKTSTITIVSRDAPGFGFNDPTPVEPVGGNPGTTLGAQRYNVYRYVADIWEKNLTSPVEIKVSAAWEGLACTASSATLGSASAWNAWHDFPGSQPGTWYPQALANKIAKTNLSDGQPDDGTGYGNFDIKTQFNVNLGNPDCLAGSKFYLGYDGNAGANVNFAATLLHELGHGLGFSVLAVSTATGYRLAADGSAYVRTGGLPGIWERYMYDNTQGKLWLNMTNSERVASAINPLGLAWTGPIAVAGAKSMLSQTPIVKSSSPAGFVPSITYSAAAFGPALPTTGKLGVLAPVTTQSANGPGCDPYDAANTAAVKGKVAIVSRGTCTFVIKVKNAQNAGAVAVLLVNNVAGAISPAGSDPTITIPAVGISQADGNTLLAAVTAAKPYGSRSVAGAVTATLATDPTRIAGADATGRPLLYTPNPLVQGSSVSHWDVSAFPNLLMEPNINSDLTLTVVPPKDLTLPLLQDIGW